MIKESHFSCKPSLQKAKVRTKAWLRLRDVTLYFTPSFNYITLSKAGTFQSPF